jgi:hypothetical protein
MDYKIIEKIGSGIFGTTYKVEINKKLENTKNNQK